MTFLIINGFKTSTIADCQLLDIGTVKGASPRRSETSIYGANGQLAVLDGAYDGYTETLSFVVKRLSDVVTLIGKFKLTDNELRLWYQEDSIRYADYLGSSYQPRGLNYWQVDVEVYLHPFRYATGVADVVLAKSGTVNNPGTVYAEPVIELVGSGAVSLTIGKQTMRLTLDTKATIDCRHQKQAIYDKNGQIKNTIRTSGPFFELPVGRSGVSTSGNVTKITIKGNWRYLI